MPSSNPDMSMPSPPANPSEELNRLFDIVTTLRSKNGCPWDIKQTPDSIKKYLLEECRELAEAIEDGTPSHICEELGDMFYILTMLIVMFEENKSFSLSDVILQICEKMVRRHPHVFDDAEVSSEQELREQWQRIKTLEKNN